MSLDAPAVAPVRQLAERIRAGVQQVVVGRDEAIELLTVALLARGHALIEDVPGTGKTTLCKALAAALHCKFGRIQFTPDLVPADVLGVNVYDPATRAFRFQPGPIFAELVLADEINRATPRTQSALLEAMQEAQVSVDGATSPLPELFMVIATLNPVEMEGTFPLPEAQLDRFLLRVAVGYPTPEEERRMLARFEAHDGASIAPVATPADILAARDAVSGVRVEPPVRDYLLAVVAATRRHEQLALGASPRAALALQHAAQARAAVAGRSFVLPDDVKALAVPALAHRLITQTSSVLRGLSREQIVSEILAATPVPMET